VAEGVQHGDAGLLARWREVSHEIEAAGSRLLAVSKYADEASVAALVRAGQQDFAESRPQQLRDRAQRYPDVCWHMIGPLQKNKAKYIARHASMWHSVEDIDTARAVNALVEGRLPVLVQVNMAGIAHQHGVAPEQMPALLAELNGLPHLQVVGLMCMAPRGGDARAVFAALRGLRDSLQDGSLEVAAGMPDEGLKLCMGMSGDYRVAIQEGSDMVRIGSTLFGPVA